MSSTWLFLDIPRQRGPAVRRWQELLLAFDYSLGKWGADGVFGNDTDDATRKYQRDNGLKVDGIVGPATLASAEKLFAAGTAKRPSVAGVTPTLVNGVEVWDYRAIAKPPKNFSRLRAWSEISGVMLHRTACVLGENPARYLPVNAHIGVTMGGRIVLAHASDKRIWHGHSPSPWTIGVEIDGNPEGRPGYWWKPGGGPHDVTDAQVRACDVLLDLLVSEFQTNGREFQYVVAHRQSSDQRESDPGWQTWKKVAIPWMEKTGAAPGPREGYPSAAKLKKPVGFSGDVWGTGLQVPVDWDPRSPVRFWS